MAQQLTVEYLDNKFDDFAAIIAEGFRAVDKRFDAVDARFDGVDKRLDAVDARFDGVDKRFEGNEKKFDRLVMEVIDLKFGQKDIAERVTRLEDSHERTFKRIDEFLVLVERHESEIAALRGGQQRMEERLG